MKITSKFRMTAQLSATDLALKPLLCSKVPVISRFLKYKLCPPPFVSRVLLSWQLVDPYLYESIKCHFNYISSYNNLISFSIASYLYVREEKANVSAIVYLQLCGFCSEGVPLSLGAWDRLGI